MKPLADFLSNIFSTKGFPARWHCGTWTTFHGWLHVVSDVAIAGAYFAIPLTLAAILVRRQHIPFRKVMLLFAGFIFFCGMTHLLDAALFWHPFYRLSGVFKLLTALISWATVFALIPISKAAVRFSSPQELRREVQQRTTELKDSRKRLKKANAALQQKSEEMEQFVRMVSHDLKSPLVTSNGFLSILEEELKLSGSEIVRDCLQRISKANGHMKQLIDDLMQVSRLGSVPSEPEWLDAEKMIRDAIAAHRQMVERCVAEVHVQEPVPKIYADPVRFMEVVHNLLSNALKHACSAAKTRIIFGLVEADGEHRLYVRDNGPGLSAEDLHRVFGVFQKGATGGSGSGIGLSIVARIAESHGGKAWAESIQGQGATFWVSFSYERTKREQVITRSQLPQPHV